MKAIIYNLLAWAILPFMDTIAKYLSSDLSFFQITWARYFFTVFFTLPFMFFFFKKNLTWSTQPKLQIFRGLTLFCANILFFYFLGCHLQLFHQISDELANDFSYKIRTFRSFFLSKSLLFLYTGMILNLDMLKTE